MATGEPELTDTKTTPASRLYAIDWRARPLIMEWSAAITVFLCLVASRGSHIFLPLFALVVAYATTLHSNGATARNGLLKALIQPQSLRSPLGIATLCFLGYMAASALWAHRPEATLAKTAHIFVLALVFALAWNAFGRLTRYDAWLMSRGALHAAALAALYLAAELLTGGGVKAFVINTTGLIPHQQSHLLDETGSVAAIKIHFLNRNMAALVLLLPALFAAALVWLHHAPVMRRFVLGLIAVTAALLVSQSNSETGKLAFAVGVLAALVAYASLSWARWLSVAAWSAVCLLILPLVWLVFAPGSAFVEQLPRTARDRTVIWTHTAKRTLEQPLIGVGANQTRYVPRLDPATVPYKQFQPRLSYHAHNVFLQTWFELGAIGALALLALGIAAFAPVFSMTGPVAILSIALSGVAVMVAFSGYGMWQAWLITMLFFAVLFLRVFSRHDAAWRESV